jgi:hypothetical protein
MVERHARPGATPGRRYQIERPDDLARATMTVDEHLAAFTAARRRTSYAAIPSRVRTPPAAVGKGPAALSGSVDPDA